MINISQLWDINIVLFSDSTYVRDSISSNFLPYFLYYFYSPISSTLEDQQSCNLILEHFYLLSAFLPCANMLLFQSQKLLCYTIIHEKYNFPKVVTFGQKFIEACLNLIISVNEGDIIPIQKITMSETFGYHIIVYNSISISMLNVSCYYPI